MWENCCNKYNHKKCYDIILYGQTDKINVSDINATYVPNGNFCRLELATSVFSKTKAINIYNDNYIGKKIHWYQNKNSHSCVTNIKLESKYYTGLIFLCISFILCCYTIIFYVKYQIKQRLVTQVNYNGANNDDTNQIVIVVSSDQNSEFIFK